MAAVDFLPDEIVLNILARLPTKPLIRSRSVSRYWRRMLMNPYFMKLRSRKTIILHINRETLDFIDGNVSTNDDSTYSAFKRCYPLEHLHTMRAYARLIGSFNGLVLIVYIKDLILYNPFTGESKKLPDPPTPIMYRNGYGFGYGDTPSDLKLVKFIEFSHRFEVYDFKRNSWSSWSSDKYGIRYIMFRHSVGTFLNGYLYWIKSQHGLIVCSVKDMVLSEINLPSTTSKTTFGNLGTINGCLCWLKVTNSSIFKLWVMKEPSSIESSSWVNTHSFTLDHKWDFYHPLNIFDDGKILIVSVFKKLIVYDISKGSYETLNIALTSERFPIQQMNCIQYVETLVSPSDVCISRLDGR
ncbi:F-box/kelch-repeat protein At3g06240-like [Rutidosis leptorrhynchoides]|uniref:F-box/kelch-repeat protein At3g06240-like n=1 Tax=Rutidosis leptorrhynchoides TaxID=125765 RepID=UPI003A996896